MKISDVIEELEWIKRAHGDIECQVQNVPREGKEIVGQKNFFIMPERQDGEGEVECNIRTWLYNTVE